MKKVILLYALIILALSSCTSVEGELGGLLGAKGERISRFYATTEQSAAETKEFWKN